MVAVGNDLKAMSANNTNTDTIGSYVLWVSSQDEHNADRATACVA